RISLPTYPFAREPFWLPGGKVLITPSTPATAETSLLYSVWEPVARPSHDAPRLAPLRGRGNQVVGMARFRAVRPLGPLRGGRAVRPLAPLRGRRAVRPFPAVTDRIAIIGGDEEAVGAICHHYPRARVVAIHAGDDIDGIAHALGGAAIDHLF